MMNVLIYDGELVMVYPEVLEELSLRHGQNITEEVFWKVIGLNASLGIAKILLSNSKSIPQK
jgi:hypothetical protein